jgi:predicted RNA-binding Zn ribbon-like protein
MELLSLDFVNSVFRDFRGRWERDDLQNPAWLAHFLQKWHLDVEQPADAAVLEELTELRTLLTHVIETLARQQTIEQQDLEELNARLSKTSFSYQIAPLDQGYHLESIPARKDWTWVQSEIISDFMALLNDYDPLRLKMCANPYCRWVFYDETKSRTRRYCTTEKCANLWKLRRFRERHKSSSSG